MDAHRNKERPHSNSFIGNKYSKMEREKRSTKHTPVLSIILKYLESEAMGMIQTEFDESDVL